MSAASSPRNPLLSRLRLMSLHKAWGRTVSCTVTVAVQLPVFPCASVAVSTTVFGPMSAQPKVCGSTDRLSMPQASAEPSSTSMGTISTAPEGSSHAVRCLQTTTGGTVSTKPGSAWSSSPLQSLSMPSQDSDAAGWTAASVSSQSELSVTKPAGAVQRNVSTAGSP